MNNLKKLVTAALMAALTCFATYIIRIPSPVGGYAHLGDSFVILSGLILGPIYGGLAAGIGSLLAELIAGYPQYAIATLIIKALAAVAASLLLKYGKKNLSKRSMAVSTVILSGIFAAVIVTPGYFIYESFLYGVGGALTAIPLNLVQNLLGLVLSVILYPILQSVPQIRDLNMK